MNKIENKLLDLKQKIERSKTRVSELRGQQKQLMNQLKKEWNCATLDQAEEKITELERQTDEINDEIKTAIKELEEQYDFEL